MDGVSPGMIVGGSAFMVGAFLLFRELQRGTGGARGDEGRANIHKYITAPGKQPQHTRIRVAAVLMVLGALTSGVSATILSQRSSKPCYDACREEGWKAGRLRGNPHEVADGTRNYQCWCQNGSEWSTEPLALEEREGEE